MTHDEFLNKQVALIYTLAEKSGIVRCVATNVFGSSQASAKIVVSDSKGEH